jgi:protein-tyrosine phosphatase
MQNIRWVAVGSGRLALSHRPKLKDIAKLPGQGCSRLLTIQGNHEAPDQIERAVRRAGLAWTWIPVGDAKFPQEEADKLMRRGLMELVAGIEAGESVLIHCSAGIHRTGMLAFGLLRWLGLSEEEALEKIATMRPQTRDGMHKEHMAWGNQIAAEAGRA